jgi:predicted nucleotidyltransferase
MYIQTFDSILNDLVERITAEPVLGRLYEIKRNLMDLLKFIIDVAEEENIPVYQVRNSTEIIKALAKVIDKQTKFVKLIVGPENQTVISGLDMMIDLAKKLSRYTEVIQESESQIKENLQKTINMADWIDWSDLGYVGNLFRDRL